MRQDSPYFRSHTRADQGEIGVKPSLVVRLDREEDLQEIQGFSYTGEVFQMIYWTRVHRTESCERSSLPGRRRRTARWRFETVAQIVRLLDTIKAPGSPGHLSRPSDEGKVVEPTV